LVERGPEEPCVGGSIPSRTTFLPVWCNGSTRVFGALCNGSSPLAGTLPCSITASTQDSGPWSLRSNRSKATHGGISVAVSTGVCGALSTSSNLVYHTNRPFSLMDKTGGYGPSDKRSIRLGASTHVGGVTVARQSPKLFVRVRIPSFVH
jgi:hypothetical protein